MRGKNYFRNNCFIFFDDFIIIRACEKVLLGKPRIVYWLFPEHCSFVINKEKCLLPPEFIMEINDDGNNKFMVGVTCSGHKQNLEEKFLFLQRNNQIPQGEFVFTALRAIQTKCVTGNQEDEDEVQLKRL